MPISIVHSEELPAFANARRREAQVKRWSRAKRKALAAGDGYSPPRRGRAGEISAQTRFLRGKCATAETAFGRLFVLTGCIPSLHSLYKEQDLISDASLVGGWAERDGKWIKTCLEERPDAIKHEKVVGGVLLTAQPKELQAFLTKHDRTADAWDKCSPLMRRAGKPTE